MSLLRRIEKTPRSLILRKLLEKLTQSADFKSQIDTIESEEGITLSDEERKKLQEIPIDYLLDEEKPPTPVVNDASADSGSSQSLFRRVPKPDSDTVIPLKSRISAKLLNDEKASQITDRRELQEHVEGLINELLAEVDTKLSRVERLHLAETITNEIIGFGPLDNLMRDDSINEILVLGPKNIYVTRKGHREKVSQQFEDNNHVLRVLDRLVAPLGRRIDENEPMISVRLPDGSRVEAVISPIAANGPSLTIYKYSRKLLTDEDLLRFGSLPSEALAFLHVCVQAEMNIIVSGTETVGKTTLLNILAGFLSIYGFTVTVEDVLELHLPQPEVLVLETRSTMVEGKDKISRAELVRQAIRMHAHYIVVSEIHGEEALELARSGRMWMTTVRSPSIEDTLAFLQTLSASKNGQHPSKALHNTLTDSVDLVVHLDRLKDGVRKVTRIAEIVRPVGGGDYVINDLFAFDYQGEDKAHVLGKLKRTDQKPSENFLQRLIHFEVDKALQEQILQLFK